MRDTSVSRPIILVGRTGRFDIDGSMTRNAGNVSVPSGTAAVVQRHAQCAHTKIGHVAHTRADSHRLGDQNLAAVPGRLHRAAVFTTGPK